MIARIIGRLAFLLLIAISLETHTCSSFPGACCLYERKFKGLLLSRDTVT